MSNKVINNYILLYSCIIAHSTRFDAVTFTMKMTNDIINTYFESVISIRNDLLSLARCKTKLLILSTYYKVIKMK